MLRLLTSISLFIALLTTGVLPSHAYWLESPQPKPFTMPGERENAPPSDQKGILTVQDNFNLFTKQDGTNPILLPHSDYFVPADIININIPLFSIFSHPPQQAGDPIANLLYANLKIKKLLEEYAELQERAKELINTSPANLPSGKMHTAGDISIQQELAAKQAVISTLNTEKIVHTIQDSSENEASSKTRAAVLSLQQLQQTIENQRQLTKLAVNNTPQTGKMVVPARQNGSKRNFSPQATPQPSNRENRRSSDMGEIKLPLILELPFKIFNYLISHKIQALIIGFMALMFIDIIFGSRS
jgi:hypothetical protein